MKSKLLIVILFMTCCTYSYAEGGFDTNFVINHPKEIIVSAVLSTGIYYGCRQVFETRWGCMFGSMVVTQFFMVLGVSTSDSGNVMMDKLRDHAIGSAITIPISIFDR
jgi:hypothetical protein